MDEIWNICPLLYPFWQRKCALSIIWVHSVQSTEQHVSFLGRKEKLDASYHLQRFNADIREIMDWVQKLQALMEGVSLAKNAGDVEARIEEHQERKVCL